MPNSFGALGNKYNYTYTHICILCIFCIPVVPHKAVAEVSKIENYRRGELL